MFTRKMVIPRTWIRKETHECKDFSTVLIRETKILYFRVFQSHSGCNPIGPTPQGLCVDFERFLRVHLLCWMCNQFTFHHKVRIESGRTKFQQGKLQFSTAVNPMNKEHRDRQEQKWDRHKNTVCWVDIQFAVRKGLKFYHTRSNAIILHDTFPVSVSR